MHNFRETIISKLKSFFRSNNKIYAAWEGGSAATGYLDEYSDLDLGLICHNDSVEEIFKGLEEFLLANYGLKKKFRIPEPSWHGHSQCFYILKKTPSLFYLDVLIEKISSRNRFIESDRHGDAQIWFDKKSLLDTTPTSEEIIKSKCRSQYKIMVDSFDFTLIEAKKQIKRGKKIDAIIFYYSLLNSKLGTILNLKYRSHKFDFGLRYAERAYPPKETELLEKLLFVEDMVDLEKKLEILTKKFRQLSKELEKKFQ